VPGNEGEWAAEAKWDGARVLASVDRGTAVLRGRGGGDVTGTYPEVAASLGRAAGRRTVILDGEITVFDGDRPSFAMLQRRMHATRPAPALLAAAPVTYVAFDLLWQARALADASREVGLEGIVLICSASAFKLVTALQEAKALQARRCGPDCHRLRRGADVRRDPPRAGRTAADPPHDLPWARRPPLAIPGTRFRPANDLHSLISQLNRHGISARAARNGALAALASDLPAAVLADFLGLHVDTAVRWVTFAPKDWTDYLAARDADLAPAPAIPKEPDEQDGPA
jgi:ATP dependent DNA ligase domain